MLANAAERMRLQSSLSALQGEARDDAEVAAEMVGMDTASVAQSELSAETSEFEAMEPKTEACS